MKPALECQADVGRGGAVYRQNYVIDVSVISTEHEAIDVSGRRESAVGANVDLAIGDRST
jgi:hypothetical protein